MLPQIESGLFVAAKGGGLVAFLYGVFRFAKWAIDRFFERHDRKEAALDKRERDFERKVLAEVASLRSELAQTKLAVHKLSAELHKKDPANPVLAEVALLLVPGFPLRSSDFSSRDDDLLDKLDGQP